MNRKRVKVSRGLLEKRYVLELVEYLDKVLNVDPSKFISSRLYRTCIDEFCFIHEGSGKLDGVTLLHSGLWIGLLINGKAYLSPIVYERVYGEVGFRAAIVVGERGVKNFLYGRDVLEESIIKKYPPLDNSLAVIDVFDGSVIGVVEPRGSVYRNVYDLGMFLRILG